MKGPVPTGFLLNSSALVSALLQMMEAASRLRRYSSALKGAEVLMVTV